MGGSPPCKVSCIFVFWGFLCEYVILLVYLFSEVWDSSLFSNFTGIRGALCVALWCVGLF